MKPTDKPKKMVTLTADIEWDTMQSLRLLAATKKDRKGKKCLMKELVQKALETLIRNEARKR
jgi:hypothetical protein